MIPNNQLEEWQNICDVAPAFQDSQTENDKLAYTAKTAMPKLIEEVKRLREELTRHQIISCMPIDLDVEWRKAQNGKA